MKKIVTISGTSRPNNYTAKALGVVNDELRKKGVDLTSFDAREISLTFPGEAESADAAQLKAAVSAATGVVIATPEYHGGFAAMTKLIIENLGFPSRLSGKPVILVGVAAGRIGAIKSLEQLKNICSHVGAIVIPGSVSIAGIQTVFDADGVCTDPATEKSLRGVAESICGFISEYIQPKQALEEIIRCSEKGWTTTV